MTSIKTESNTLNKPDNITGKASGGELPQKQILKAFKTTTKTISDAFLKVKTYRDNINSVIRASKLEYTIEDGKKKYKSSYFSTYAWLAYSKKKSPL